VTAEPERASARLSRLAAEMEAVAAELAKLDPQSMTPRLLRHWRTEIALVVRELGEESRRDAK